MSRIGLRIALASLALATMPVVAAEDMERGQLAALIRQLDMLDYSVRRSEALAQHTDRYHFDYARLHEDLARIRAGIEQHLTPSRAQPREPDAAPAVAAP